MGIDAIKNFRQKYPGAYTDRTDEEIAAALARKFPKAYGNLPAMVARDTTISGYNEKSQKTARLAEERPNMIDIAQKELQYNPYNVANTGGQMLVKGALQPSVFGLKAMGAAGQTEEAAASAPIIARQRGLDPYTPEYWEEIRRSVSGEAPTEFGDVYRNMGWPEPLAAGAGLVTSLGLPGFSGYSKVGREVWQGARGLTRKVLQGTARGATKAHLNLLARSEPALIDRFLEKRGKMMNPAQTFEDIEAQLHGAVSKAENSVSTRQREAYSMYKAGMSQAKNDTVNIARQPKGVPTFDQVLSDGADEGVWHWEDVLNDEGDIIDKKLTGNPRLPGSVALANVVDDLEHKRVTTVGEVRKRMIEIEPILEKIEDRNGAGTNAASDKVRNVAYDIQKALRAAMHEQSPTMAKVNGVYKNMLAGLEEDEVQKLPGILDLLKKNAEGTSRIANYYDLKYPARKVLEQFDRNLPPGLRFLDELKDAAVNHEYGRVTPRASFSLMAPGAILTNLIGRAHYLPMLAGGVGLASPRTAALGHRAIMEMSEKIAQKRVAAMNKPIGQAITNLVSRGILGTGLNRYMTRDAFANSAQ